MGCKCTEGCSNEETCCAGLRDDLAKAALTGLCMAQGAERVKLILVGEIGGKLLAEASYMIADAMLKARNA